MAKQSLALILSFFSASKYIAGFGLNFFTNFELPIKLKSFLCIEFLNEYNIAFILFVDVDESKANFIFSFLQNKIKFLTPGLNLSWFFFKVIIEYFSF